MSLNRLAEVCGCFSSQEASFGCHHPESPCQDCSNHRCPLAYTDYSGCATEADEERLDSQYGDAIPMELMSAGEGKFGIGGVVTQFRESRIAELPEPSAHV
jgi:hypothetical protein